MLDKLSKLSVRNIWTISGGLVFLVMALFFLMIYLPKNSEIDSKQEELETLQTEIAESKKIAKKLDFIKAEVEKLNLKFKIALVQLPESKEIPELLTQISNLGTGTGLEILMFQPRKENPKDFYAEVPVFIKLRGQFHDLLSFFNKVSKLPRIVALSDLQMGGVELKNENILITAEALATTFRFIEGSEAEKGKGKK